MDKEARDCRSTAAALQRDGKSSLQRCPGHRANAENEQAVCSAHTRAYLRAPLVGIGYLERTSKCVLKLERSAASSTPSHSFTSGSTTRAVPRSSEARRSSTLARKASAEISQKRTILNQGPDVDRYVHHFCRAAMSYVSSRGTLKVHGVMDAPRPMDAVRSFINDACFLG